MRMLNKIKCRFLHEMDHRYMDLPDGSKAWSCGECGHAWSSTPKRFLMAAFEFSLVIGFLWIVSMAFKDLT